MKVFSKQLKVVGICSGCEDEEDLSCPKCRVDIPVPSEFRAGHKRKENSDLEKRIRTAEQKAHYEGSQ